MSPTRVVNVRVDPFDVYIGRAGHGYDGYFGNPHTVGLKCPVCKHVGHTRDEAIEAFKAYFDARIASDTEYRRRVLELQAKRLGCFCTRQGDITGSETPWTCHGQVYAAWLDTLPEEDLPNGRLLP